MNPIASKPLLYSTHAPRTYLVAAWRAHLLAVLRVGADQGAAHERAVPMLDEIDFAQEVK